MEDERIDPLGTGLPVCPVCHKYYSPRNGEPDLKYIHVRVLGVTEGKVCLVCDERVWSVDA